MKRLFLVLISTFFMCTLLAQNILILKSGEKMNGKVERYRNDTLTFVFKGNKLQFKRNEIAAIYFDEKQVPLPQQNSPQQIEQKQEGKISGVVTYFFNDNYGDKPDIGAKVIIANAENLPDFNYNIVEGFLHGKLYRSLYNSYVARGDKKGLESIMDQVRLYQVETQEKFNSLDNRAADELSKIKFKNAVYNINLVVDGNGTVSTSVPQRKYFVYVISNNRTGDNVCEMMGKIYFTTITVKAGETANFAAKFDLY